MTVNIKCFFGFLLIILAFQLIPATIIKANNAKFSHYDVCIYGGTSAGMAAAIQAARLNLKVVLIEPSDDIGGIMVNGLSLTDIDNHPEFQNSWAVGGIALEFYRRIAKYYNRLEEFDRKQKNSIKDYTMWSFEPQAARKVIGQWLSEYKIDVVTNTELNGKEGVFKQDNKIEYIITSKKQNFFAKVFIDATIEGDLMASSGISYTWGRENNSTYNETLNGIRKETIRNQFKVKVDPYVIKGQTDSGLIYTIQNDSLGIPGSADKSIQAYCFRVCLTNNTDNQLQFSKPENYKREHYEIYLRYLKAGGKLYTPQVTIPGNKTDLGAWHDLSHNLYGMTKEYIEGSYAERSAILNLHKSFTQGLFYFFSNDSEVGRIDSVFQNTWKKWGLCRDEFTDNNGWPKQFYVRDGRRMVSDYVITEHHTQKSGHEIAIDPVAVACWPPDLHSARRIVVDGYAYNEGFVFGGNTWKPFGISYRALVPKKSECTNLITPTCISASHVAYGAIRIEFTFMALGQAAAYAAYLAIADKCLVQDVDYCKLKALLIEIKQVLEARN